MQQYDFKQPKKKTLQRVTVSLMCRVSEEQLKKLPKFPNMYLLTTCGWFSENTQLMSLFPPTNYEHLKKSMGFQVGKLNVSSSGFLDGFRFHRNIYPTKQREQRAREGAIVLKDLAGLSSRIFS